MLSVHTCPLAALGGKETGGLNVYVRELSRELGEQGLQVDVFTRSQDPSIDRVREMRQNVRVVHLPAGLEAPYDKNLVFGHLPQFISGIRAFTTANALSYDIVHSHYWLSGWVAREVAGSWGLPTVHMFHTLGKMKDSVAADDSQRETLTRIQIESELMRDMDRIVAATPLDREHMADLYAADTKKIEVIPLGVDLQLFRPIPRDEARAAIGMELQKDCRLVLFVGRLDPLKGLDTLLRAMCRLAEIDRSLVKDLCLAVVGGDADESPATQKEQLDCLDKLKAEVGMSDLVIFLGSRAQDALPYYYSAAEVCVMPSLYESFGLVALEAMACRTPVVASRVGGLQHIVDDGSTGFLVPAGDPEVLAQKLQEVLSRPELRERLAACALSKAQGFTWRSVADRIRNIYEELWQTR